MTLRTVLCHRYGFPTSKPYESHIKDTHIDNILNAYNVYIEYKY